MGVILDTNALSAFADGHPIVTELVSKAADLALPVIVLGEYTFGILQSRDRVKYELWLQRTMALSRVLDIDQQTMRYYATVRLELKRTGRPIPSNDVWIAALTRQHAMPLLSRDRHFDGISGLTRVGW